MTTQTKMQARERIAQILRAALDVAPRVGYSKLTREDIARKANIPASLVSYHLGTMTELRRQIMREAVRTECLPVIAQGLAVGDRQARKAPAELKHRALMALDH